MRARPTAVLIAAGALALTACSGDEADAPGTTETVTETVGDDTSTTDEPSPTATTPDETSSPTASPAPTSTAGGVPDLSTECELQPGDAADVEAVTFAVPEGWQVEDGNCEFFDPTMEELPEDTEAGTALSVRITDSAFPDVASDTDELRHDGRWAGARSGYQAVRILGESTGQGLFPEGETRQLVLVDLDAGTDETGGTLVMSAGPSNGASFELASAALDRMARTVHVDAPAVDDPVVVTRMEGGGTPWTVTYDQSEGCFHLRAGGPTDDPTAETCDVSPTDDGIAGAILTSGEQQVAVGHAPPRAVLVESDAASAPYGALTQPAEGSTLFAYDVTDTPVDVRADDADGNELASTTLE